MASWADVALTILGGVGGDHYVNPANSYLLAHQPPGYVASPVYKCRHCHTEFSPFTIRGPDPGFAASYSLKPIEGLDHVSLMAHGEIWHECSDEDHSIGVFGVADLIKIVMEPTPE